MSVLKDINKIAEFRESASSFDEMKDEISEIYN
jgi:hypothetical protein